MLIKELMYLMIQSTFSDRVKLLSLFYIDFLIRSSSCFLNRGKGKPAFCSCFLMKLTSDSIK